MSNRITPTRLNRWVEELNKEFGHVVRIKMDHMTAGYRVETEGGGRSLSPRMTPREVVKWLDGFEEGMRKSEEWWKTNVVDIVDKTINQFDKGGSTNG